jgi:glycosyltransferase involved in cell wall biosynthesis
MSDKVKIVYLLDKTQYISKMSRVRFHAIDALAKLADVTFWGPGWRHYDEEESVDDNIERMGLDIEVVICYKPSILVDFYKSKYLKVITYNEMWDYNYTVNEINLGKPDLIICHHANDMTHYVGRLYKDLHSYNRFVHIAHSAEKSIFYDKGYDKPIDVMLNGSIGRHYPIRIRLREIMKIMPKKYKCIEYQHPGYIHGDAFTDAYLKDYAENINKAKICISCTSKYKYRLGKMVEIPMCGSVLACDIPGQNEEEFRDVMIVIEDDDSDQDIIDKLVYYLEHPKELENIRKKGYKWAQEWGQDRYGKDFLREIKTTLKTKREIKVFVIADELTSIKEKWICDILKEEFIEHSGVKIVNNSGDADIIWLLAPWSQRKVNRKDLEEKFVVTTIHHIDWDKYEDNKSYYELIDSLTNRYHCICPKAEESLKKITKKDIVTTNFWINENNFYQIEDKHLLRERYNLPHDAYIVGSFQKDTEGTDENMPKLSKGPEIFVEIVNDMKHNGKNVHVLLTGWRRTYVINRLIDLDIPYTYLELVPASELNELYNCLDLYLVSSRVEGGPRAIIECGLAKVPLISTDVGIAELILPEDSIYDMNDWKSYSKAVPCVDIAHKNSLEYTISKGYIKEFTKKVFFELW